MQYLGEAIVWKRFGEFTLPNIANMLYGLREELVVKKDSVGQIVDLFNEIVAEVEDDKNKGLFTQIMS